MATVNDELVKRLREKNAALTGTILAKLAHGEGTPEMAALIVSLKAASQEAAIALSHQEAPAGMPDDAVPFLAQDHGMVVWQNDYDRLRAYALSLATELKTRKEKRDQLTNAANTEEA